MMYVTEHMVGEMIALYGHPEKASFSFGVSREEFSRIRASQKHGRKHDFTVYIFKDSKIVVIAKPFYSPGLFRAPSGGLRPGEDFHEGIYREIWEETGCTMKIEKFLLRTEVTFDRRDDTDCQGDSSIDWTSFVFQARYTEGAFEFTDHREIREVRLATLADFREYSRAMRESEIGGFHYRAALHDAVKGLLTA